MKKVFLAVFFTVFSSSLLFGQNVYLVGGLSGSIVSFSYADVPDFYDEFPVLAPNVGVFYEAGINRTWSLKPGIFANKQGVKLVSEPTSGYYVENKYIISYVEAPLLLCYKFRRSSKRDLHMSVSAGPFFSYGYYGKFITSNAAIYEEENIFVGSDDLFRSNYGATIMFTTGYDNHRLSAYISPGLRNIAMSGGIFTKFRTMSAGISYNFILNTNPKKSGFVLKKMFY